MNTLNDATTLSPRSKAKWPNRLPQLLEGSPSLDLYLPFGFKTRASLAITDMSPHDHLRVTDIHIHLKRTSIEWSSLPMFGIGSSCSADAEAHEGVRQRTRRFAVIQSCQPEKTAIVVCRISRSNSGSASTESTRIQEVSCRNRPQFPWVGTVALEPAPALALKIWRQLPPQTGLPCVKQLSLFVSSTNIPEPRVDLFIIAPVIVRAWIGK